MSRTERRVGRVESMLAVAPAEKSAHARIRLYPVGRRYQNPAAAERAVAVSYRRIVTFEPAERSVFSERISYTSLMSRLSRRMQPSESARPMLCGEFVP